MFCIPKKPIEKSPLIPPGIKLKSRVAHSTFEDISYFKDRVGGVHRLSGKYGQKAETLGWKRAEPKEAFEAMKNKCIAKKKLIAATKRKR